jgi:hypothetical protein
MRDHLPTSDPWRRSKSATLQAPKSTSSRVQTTGFETRSTPAIEERYANFQCRLADGRLIEV